MNKVGIRRLHAPVQEITVKLEQWEDRRIEHGAEEGLTLSIKEAKEPECFELRSDGGHQVLNKGELAHIGKAFLELADYEVALLPEKTEKERLGMVERPPPPAAKNSKKKRATMRRVRP